MPKSTPPKALQGPRASAQATPPTTTKLPTTTTTLPEFSHLSILLTALHTRNKNQHRRSPWWPHFQQFRKFVTRFTPAHPPNKNAYIQNQRLEKVIEIVRTAKAARWNRAFKQLVSDNQFAALGLVLLAALARVMHILGIEEFGDVGEADVGSGRGRTEGLGEVAREKELMELGRVEGADERIGAEGEDDEEWEGFSD